MNWDMVPNTIPVIIFSLVYHDLTPGNPQTQMYNKHQMVQIAHYRQLVSTLQKLILYAKNISISD